MRRIYWAYSKRGNYAVTIMSRYSSIVVTTRLYKLSALLIVIISVLSFIGLVPLAATILTFYISYIVANLRYLVIAGKGLSCELSSTQLLLNGDTVILQLPVSIEQLETYGHITAYLGIPSQLSSTEKPYTHVSKLGLGHQVIEVALPRRTGTHILGPLMIAVSDPLKLLEYHVYVQNFLVIRIPPRLSTAPVARWYGIIRTSSGARTLTPGHGVEYHSSREYQPGDELRYVDWKATARLGKLYVKVFEVESPLRVAILVDAHSYTFIGSPKSLFEYCVDMAVALSTYLLRRGDRLALITLSEDGMRYIGELHGASDLAEVLKMFSVIPWPRVVDVFRIEPPSIGGSLDAIAGYLRRASAAVILMPVLSERRASEIGELVRRIVDVGVKVILVVPLVTFFSASSKIDNTMYRVLRFDILSRELKNLSLLEKLDVHVITLSPHRALEKAIAELEKIRVLKAR